MPLTSTIGTHYSTLGRGQILGAGPVNMSLSLVAVIVRHERRVRLVFSNTLAAGAFFVGPYALTSNDGNGVAPLVEATLAVPNNPNAVELTLSADLVQGARYTITCTLVPATDSSFFSGSEVFGYGQVVQVLPNTEQATQDLDALLYGTDIVWSGQDYVETSTGDLAVVSGLTNAKAAVTRRCAGDPLPWDDSYSAHAYEFVDAPQASQLTLRGAILQQCKLDDRVKDAIVNIVLENDTGVGSLFNSGDARFDVTVWFIGGEQATPWSFGLPGGGK